MQPKVVIEELDLTRSVKHLLPFLFMFNAKFGLFVSAFPNHRILGSVQWHVGPGIGREAVFYGLNLDIAGCGLGCSGVRDVKKTCFFALCFFVVLKLFLCFLCFFLWPVLSTFNVCFDCLNQFDALNYHIK